MALPLLNQLAALAGASCDTQIASELVPANGRELAGTINLPITDHTNAYVLALSHFPPPSS